MGGQKTRPSAGTYGASGRRSRRRSKRLEISALQRRNRRRKNLGARRGRLQVHGLWQYGRRKRTHKRRLCARTGYLFLLWRRRGKLGRQCDCGSKISFRNFGSKTRACHRRGRRYGFKRTVQKIPCQKCGRHRRSGKRLCRLQIHRQKQRRTQQRAAQKHAVRAPCKIHTLQ